MNLTKILFSKALRNYVQYTTVCLKSYGNCDIAVSNACIGGIFREILSERMTAKRRVCYQPIHFLCLNIAYEAFTEKETRLYGEYHFFF
jgi:hypothetical protein